MATVRENIKNALTWFYDRLKDKYLDPFDKRISDNATNIATNTTDISGKAPTSHASSDTTYGVGTTSNYGHCRTINNLTTSSHTNGYALSAYQGYLLNSDISTANTNITKNAEDISTLNTDLTTLSTRVGYHGTYTGNIDDLHGAEDAGGYWCHSTDCSGDQPFGDSTTSRYYFLEVSRSNNSHVQRAVRYDTGDVKFRAYSNNQWYDWTGFPQIQFGTIQATNATGGTATQYDVTFNSAFDSTPRISLTIGGTSTSEVYANIQPFVYSVSTTGFVLGVANANSGTLNPNIHWIAIGSIL